MLSRVAENIYWMGRYAERAENTARLVKSTYDMMLDLPRHVPVDWSTLVDVLGCWSESQSQSQGNASTPTTESGIMVSIISSLDNPSSMVSSVYAARQKARNNRETLPQSAWEVINSCYHYMRDNADLLATRQGRIRYCEKVQHQCEQFIGILINSMSRDLGYFFFRLGQMVERADMITRVIDAKASLVHYLREEQIKDFDTFRSFFWLNALDAVDATQSFRRLTQSEISRETAIRFLLNESRQPRTVKYCLNEIELQLGMLPDGVALMQPVADLHKQVSTYSDSGLNDITEQMDLLQAQFGQLHDTICDKYFAFQA